MINNDQELDIAKERLKMRRETATNLRASNDVDTANVVEQQANNIEQEINAYELSKSAINSYSPQPLPVGSPIVLIMGDITKVDVDVIVNAANSELRAGSGVCGAIYAAAGRDQMLEETDELGPVPTGMAVVSLGYNLPFAKHVIHAVGPIFTDGIHGEYELLRSTYKRSMELADKVEAKSIAFPCISTGVYKFPKDQAAYIAINTVIGELMSQRFHTRLKSSTVQRVVFVCYEQEDFDIYKEILDSLISITKPD